MVSRRAATAWFNTPTDAEPFPATCPLAQCPISQLSPCARPSDDSGPLFACRCVPCAMHNPAESPPGCRRFCCWQAAPLQLLDSTPVNADPCVRFRPPSLAMRPSLELPCVRVCASDAATASDALVAGSVASGLETGVELGGAVGCRVAGALRLVFKGLFSKLLGSTPPASFWRILHNMSALGK